MRVIGGAAKGRRLLAPKGQAVRPTADRVKESLFNILPRDLSGMTVLDLFAGTGNLSIEALSHGAAHAVLVDSSARSAAAIKENLRRLGFAANSEVWLAPAARSLRRLARRQTRFDLIFLDPPYDSGLAPRTLAIIAQCNVLRESGTVVVEHSVREPLHQRCGSLELHDQRRYGDTLLSFYKPIDPASRG
ncbi:MAG TPA: 16S rRNA (guanine(966)-N(2))-methyltransferase RsmD [Candidatus Binatia bacterium]|nr:16S rRNA (guanine(966)-N(2))-methyltransferase RsmD [Candidatus Binatia bacterium]